MRTDRHFTLAAMALTILATIFLVACQTTEQKAITATTSAAAPAAEAVYVIFEGPWAIVPDPKDANSVLAIAPKTKSHRLLEVTPSDVEFDAGVYELAVPAHGTPAPLGLDKIFFRTAVDSKKVQHALDNKMNRYAVRLPKPESYKAVTRNQSRIGNTYPPAASTQQGYVSAVSLVYNVTSKTGFSLSGTKDSGAAVGPILFQLDTPMVRFEIEPAAENLGLDTCHTHSRQAFHDLTKLLSVTLYTDFPDSPDKCHKTDPQVTSGAKADLPQNWPAWGTGEPAMAEVTPTYAAALSGGVPGTYLDSEVGKVASSVEAAIYFFHAEGGACYAPIIFGI